MAILEHRVVLCMPANAGVAHIKSLGLMGQKVVPANAGCPVRNGGAFFLFEQIPRIHL